MLFTKLDRYALRSDTGKSIHLILSKDTVWITVLRSTVGFIVNATLQEYRKYT